jgi:hypothetical protein
MVKACSLQLINDKLNRAYGKVSDCLASEINWILVKIVRTMG